jgi:hypothetical protein
MLAPASILVRLWWPPLVGVYELASMELALLYMLTSLLCWCGELIGAPYAAACREKVWPGPPSGNCDCDALWCTCEKPGNRPEGTAPLWLPVCNRSGDMAAAQDAR